MAIPLKVAIYKGSDLVGEQRFDRDIIKIGRLASAHLKLEDPKVSRIHAVIEVSSDGQELSIIDMGSSDGTFVNGERISKEKLRDGDEVRVGDCRLVVTLDDGVAVDAQQVVGASQVSGDLPNMGTPPMPPPMSFPPGDESAAWVGGMSPENMPTGVYAAQSLQVQAAATGQAQAMWPQQPQQQQAWQQDPAAIAAAQAQAMAVAQAQAQIAAPVAPMMVGTMPGVAMPGNGGAMQMQAAYEAAYAQQLAMQSQLQAAQQPGTWVQPAMDASQYPTGVPMPADYAYPSQWSTQPAGVWGSVPNNLASEGVSESERALEIKLVWGNSVIDTLNVTNQPLITLGDEPKIEGWGPFKHVVRCDIDAPSKGLPAHRYPFAISNSAEGCSYGITLHASFSGYVEKADGTTYALSDVVQSGKGIDRGELPETWVYALKPEETLYVTHGLLTMQVRYVRRARFVAAPLFERLNYGWLNILILAFFFHALAIATFLASPRTETSLEEDLFKNPNRFAQFRLTPEKKKEQENFLAKLKAGEMGAKAKGNEGKAGKKDHKAKTSGRMAVKAVDPNDKEIAKSTLAKLFDSGNRSQSYLFGSGGLGGELKGALGGVTGAQIGDAAGLGGLGTRGAGPGGGGLSMNSVGLGALGTQGRGGGGDGSYGQGVGSLGKKAERDINISAGNPVIMGSLDKELIRRVIEQHKAQIRYCYEKELVRTPGLFGKINMEWVITAEGTVRDSKAKESTMNNAEVDRCIASKIRTWIFPKPKGGGIVIVRYPFVFKTTG